MHRFFKKSLIIPFLVLVFILTIIRVGTPALEDFLVANKPLRHADALVVMAGSTSERLPAAAVLYKEGRASKILLANDGIFSSWSEEKQRNFYEVEWAEYDLVKMRVPEAAIVKLPYSSSGSIHDALNTRKYVLEKGLKSIIIVTSEYHTRRSLWIFERVFRGYPVMIGVYPAKSDVKSMRYYKRFILLTCEIVKLVYYEFRYSFSIDSL